MGFQATPKGVYICVYINIIAEHMYVCTCIKCMCLYVHTYIHACMHTYIHTYTCACMHAYIHIHACMQACNHTYMYVGTHLNSMYLVFHT